MTLDVGLCRRLSESRVAQCFALLLLSASTSAFAGTTSYTYDVHGRLKTQTTPVGVDSSTVTYTYDNAGNRLTVVTNLADTSPPNVPTGLTATAVSHQQINLSWNTTLDVGYSGLNRYILRRGGTIIAEPTGTTHQDTGLAGSTTYSYTIAAIDNATNPSGQSAAVPATTSPTPDTTPPSTPTGLAGAAVSATWINLSWNASTDTGGSGLAGYQIFRNGSYLNSSPSASYADQTLAGGTSYNYQVRAYDGASNFSGGSNTIAVCTLDNVAPPVPTLVGVEVNGSNMLTISWQGHLDNSPCGTGLQGFKLYRNGSFLLQTANSYYVDQSVAPSTTYTYRVSALDYASPVNESAQSSPAQGTTPAAWIPITNDNGQILPAEAAWYRVDQYCDFSTGFPYCIDSYSKKYGNFGVVWEWMIDYSAPSCPYYGNYGAPGYRQVFPTCRIEASPSVYHQ